MKADDYITPVRRTVEELLGEIERLPDEVLYREPAAGEWPVMSTLAHLQELLPFWAREAGDLAASPGMPVGRSLEDPRRVEPIQEHAHDSLAAIIPRIRDALDACEATLRGIPEEGWKAVGQHIRSGPMSVEELVQSFVVRHADEHAKQIRATLAALGPAKS